MCDGLGSTLAAMFGVLPNTSFSQNVGLVAMTKVVNRVALASGAVFLILCGLIAEGETQIGEIYHIQRGYVDIDKKIRSLGGNIEIVEC